MAHIREFLYLACLLFASNAAIAGTNDSIIVTIKNNMSVGIGLQTVPYCSTYMSCPLLNSISAHSSSVKTATTKDIYSADWSFNYGQYIGTQLYACQFGVTMTVNWSGGCHTPGVYTWVTNGPGGGHPSCTASTPVQNPTTCAVTVEVDMNQ